MMRPEGTTTIRQAIDILRWNEDCAAANDELGIADDLRAAWLELAGLAVAHEFMTAGEFDDMLALDAARRPVGG